MLRPADDPQRVVWEGLLVRMGNGRIMELTDSERLLGQLSETRLQLACSVFHDCGFLVLRNAYERDWIEAVRVDIAARLEDWLETAGGWEALSSKTFGDRHLAFFPPLVGLAADSALVAHPVACQLMERILGPGFRSSFHNTNTAYPGSGMQPIHRDHGFLFGNRGTVGHPPALLVANVALCDFTEENGATEIWPGTHWIPDPEGDGLADLESRAQFLPSLRTVVPAGALILRDLRLWHRGMPNRSKWPRSMTATVYRRAWLDDAPTSIPRTTWESWTEIARSVFRQNPVVEDVLHQPRTWYDQ